MSSWLNAREVIDTGVDARSTVKLFRVTLDKAIATVLKYTV